jgi:peptidoglycan/LPS O-acetylase OafA/YrhL
MVEAKADSKKLKRREGLDGFRGFGCLLVMLGHTQWQGKMILPGALVAMDLFFVLSGFLIGSLLLSELRKTGTISLASFWKRRAIRLLPVFYVYFGIVATVYGITRFSPILGTDAEVSLLSTGLYASNWAVARGYDLGVFFVTWSLSLEEQFYVLCPLVFLFFFKLFDRKTVLVLFALGVVGINLHRYFLYHELVPLEGVLPAFKQIFYRLDTRADSLLIGCLGAVFFGVYGERFRIGPVAGILSFALLLSPILFVRNLPVAFHISETSPFTEFLAAGGFTLLALSGIVCNIHLVQFPESPLSRFLSFPLLVKVGVMSYSIYLWHTTLFGGIDILLKSFNSSGALWTVKTIIRFSAAIGVGYLSFRFIEYPLLQYNLRKRKFAPIAA